MQCRTLRLPKHGNSLEEYEDASFADEESGRFALADGATESAYAGLWARLLVRQFVDQAGCPPADWGAWLPAAQQAFLAEVGDGPRPWFEEQKLEQGAFATFLGLCVLPPAPDEPDAPGRWHALAVGDCCLFQVREETLLAAFPLERVEDFGTRPELVSSRVSAAQLRDERERRASGSWQPLDRIWLMSDAAAAWFLARHAEGGQPWRELDQMLYSAEREEEFAMWVGLLRQQKRMRNDDVTMLAVSL